MRHSRGDNGGGFSCINYGRSAGIIRAAGREWRVSRAAWEALEPRRLANSPVGLGLAGDLLLVASDPLAALLGQAPEELQGHAPPGFATAAPPMSWEAPDPNGGAEAVPEYLSIDAISSAEAEPVAAAATSDSVSSSGISQFSGYSAFGEAKYGANGGDSAWPECAAGVPTGFETGSRVWDANPYDGVDSGWVGVQLTVESSGGISWAVNGCSAGNLQRSTGSFGDIERVHVRAGAQAEGTAAWRSLSIEFYDGGSVADSYSQSGGPEVDTTSTPWWPVAEDILTVTPDVWGVDKVVVSGQVRFTSPQGVYPGPDDLFGQVFIESQYNPS